MSKTIQIRRGARHNAATASYGTLTQCATCGSQISRQATACPHCGHPGSARPRTDWSPINVLAAVILSLMILGAISSCVL
jgi:ribosomal protein L37E